MRYFGIRGGKEVTELLWDQISYMVYGDGPYKGKNYVLVNIDYDKGMCVSRLFLYILIYPLLYLIPIQVHKLSLYGKTVLKGQKMILVENSNDPACPVMALTLLRMYCPPSQKRVFCHPATTWQKVKYLEDGVPYLSNPKCSFGKGTVSQWCRNFARLIGCLGWKDMLNHCVRGGMATILNISDVSFLYVMYMLIFDSNNVFFFILGEGIRASDFGQMSPCFYHNELALCTWIMER